MTYDRTIQFDRQTRDYAMYLDGEFVGYAPNYHSAEVQLDQMIFDALIYSVVYESPPDPLPDPGPEGPGVPGDERPRAAA